MPINQNHIAEELDGMKCSVVEKNAPKARVAFLKNLLEYNGYIVVVSTTPPPKVVPSKPAAKPVTSAHGSEIPAAISATVPIVPDIDRLPIQLAPETFTVGVTDLIFNPTNAIFGRLLRTRDDHVVTLAYWQQKEEIAHDEVPYYENKM